jgi:hypothetical protein
MNITYENLFNGHFKHCFRVKGGFILQETSGKRVLSQESLLLPSSKEEKREVNLRGKRKK